MEYMAARMDDMITASQRWHEEAFDDAIRAIHTNPELSKVYAFVRTDCIYESAAAPVSMHWTKAGAYRAMNRFLFDTNRIRGCLFVVSDNNCVFCHV